MLRNLTTILAALLIAAAVHAQSSRPQFEVASIKPVKQQQCGFDPRNPPPPPSPGTLRMCTLTRGLITTAYLADVAPGERSSIVLEAPDWVNMEWYEIEAKAAGQPSQSVMNGPMLQSLLEERFKAQVHRVTREGPIYTLVRANGGPKLQPFVEGTCTPPGSPPVGGKPSCVGIVLQTRGTTATLDIAETTIKQFAQSLRLDRPVVDQTGIAGMFNVHLEFTPDSVTASMYPRIAPIAPSPETGADAATPGVTIFTALQEQLGLKLTAARGPREFLVVDHIERPAEN